MVSISQITPAAFGDGRSVTLTGTGLANATVSIGGVSQPVTSSNDTTLVFTATRGSQSMGACRVDVVGGSGGAYTPVWSENFNGYAEAESLTAGNPFTAASRTIATSAQAHGGGGRSAKMSIRTGDSGQGFGEWGGIYTLPAHLVRYDEVWVRWRQFWPAAFSFSADPFMKFLRLGTKNSGGSNAGYVDLYVDNGGSTFPTYHTVSETETPQHKSNFGSSAIPLDQWITYEMYCKFDTTAADSGGQARVRVWIDGALANEQTNLKTLGGADHYCNVVHWFTYWNDAASGQTFVPNNDTYVDDIVIATSADPPTGADAGGRPFIGA